MLAKHSCYDQVTKLLMLKAFYVKNLLQDSRGKSRTSLDSLSKAEQRKIKTFITVHTNTHRDAQTLTYLSEAEKEIHRLDQR